MTVVQYPPPAPALPDHALRRALRREPLSAQAVACEVHICRFDDPHDVRCKHFTVKQIADLTAERLQDTLERRRLERLNTSGAVVHAVPVERDRVPRPLDLPARP